MSDKIKFKLYRFIQFSVLSISIQLDVFHYIERCLYQIRNMTVAIKLFDVYWVFDFDIWCTTFRFKFSSVCCYYTFSWVLLPCCCTIFLSRNVVFCVSFNMIWLSIKPGSIHHCFSVKSLVPDQEYCSCDQIVRFYLMLAFVIL